MQKLILKLAGIFGFIAWTCFVGLICFPAGMVYKERHPDITIQDMMPTLTEQVRNIQQLTGCKVDAVIGPETMKKVNAAIKKEYCQRAHDWSVRNMPRKEQGDE